ncbi:hypothetical protein HGM15179_017983 [Zosterops borbonicus]|uniref:Retroviral Gag polyprotein M domain-containing protein n=1 Tax=Zosterops borbonicus TaxID=364589 RepID=A0A8K1LCR8_9PASS|nr:hypothetical protein HGM15179_017982 [Zosterops borbonicus]TRZ09122.1 hypothetical protein HGM15179_017983 [Zosterops borbonicus]
METLRKVISEIYVQWGIKCKAKDFDAAVKRLLTLGAIDRPVDILHSECWERCTNVLARDVIVSATSKNLKSWGKVMQALQKALEEQETWAAAQQCLRLTPKLGVGATTQTAFGNGRAEEERVLETDNLSQTVFGNDCAEKERALETGGFS